jgi:hypothetical protein
VSIYLILRANSLNTIIKKHLQNSMPLENYILLQYTDFAFKYNDTGFETTKKCPNCTAHISVSIIVRINALALEHPAAKCCKRQIINHSSK